MFSKRDQFWMQEAIALAKKAEESGEVPIGAILTQADQKISAGFNQPITLHDPTAHAEMLALREAGILLKNYRLVNTTLYVTLEPCAMCVGAIVHARVKRVIFGAYDPKSGAVESVFKLGLSTSFNHVVTYQGGLFQEECGHLLSHFFKQRRDILNSSR